MEAGVHHAGAVAKVADVEVAASVAPGGVHQSVADSVAAVEEDESAGRISAAGAEPFKPADELYDAGAFGSSEKPGRSAGS